MPFLEISQQPAREVAPGVAIRVAYGEHLMMSFVDFAYADAMVPLHSHPHEQLGMGLAGSFELIIDGEPRVIREGDVYLIPGGIPHSARAVDGPARALDIFHPVRDDYRT